MSELTHDPFDTREQPQASIPAPPDQARKADLRVWTPRVTKAFVAIVEEVGELGAFHEAVRSALLDVEESALAAAPLAAPREPDVSEASEEAHRFPDDT